MPQAVRPMYASRTMRKPEVTTWSSSTAQHSRTHAEDVGDGEFPDHDS